MPTGEVKTEEVAPPEPAEQEDNEDEEYKPAQILIDPLEDELN